MDMKTYVIWFSSLARMSICSGPPKLQALAGISLFVSRTDRGIYRGIKPEAKTYIESLPSFRSFEFFWTVGKPMVKTIDLCSTPSNVILLNDNKAQVYGHT